MHHGLALHPFRLCRWRDRRAHRRWRRLADDSPAGAVVRHSPGHGCGYRPALCRPDQIRRHRKGHVDWKIVGLLASGSIPATAITIFILSQLPKQDAATTHAISFALGIALLLTAGAIIFRKQILSYAQAHETSFLHRHQAPVTVAVGAILGVLVSISSVGAGALGVAALYFLYPRLQAVRIVGTDIAHAVPLTLVAGVGHWLLGNVDWSLLGALLLGSLPGIWVGSHISAKVPDRILRPILASMLVLIGAKLIAS